MATDLDTPKQSEDHVQHQLADLCTRIQRTDLLTHLLLFALTVLAYALLVGGFDWFVARSSAEYIPIVRWTLFGVFLTVMAILLVQTVRCVFRRVNPYFVAHQLERTLPEAKNSLINWLDLHDQGLPAAFQRNLSTRAADDLGAIDTERTLPRRRNRILLGVLALPTLGLLILLLLGPAAFLASMLRAFAPFYTPAEFPRTSITLITPAGGDAEIGMQQAIAFAVKIDGYVPAAHRPDAPRLLYRYQASEDYFTLPLAAEGAGIWSGQLLSEQIRTGFFYKVAAADAETREHQIRVRGPAHIEKFTLVYQYRAYLKTSTKTVEFPNQDARTPIIHGLRGTEVALTLHASRSVKNASVEVLAAGADAKPLVRILADDPKAFACRFTLNKSGVFRVRFTSTDGEDNVDRSDYPIDVQPDESPTVVLTSPAKDVAVAENGTLEIAGRASDDFGVKSLALHLRVLTGANKPTLQRKIYRSGKSLQFDDGSYPDAIEYRDFLALDELKDAAGTIHLLPPGTVLEYWLEATDNADYPNPTGNVGKSAAFKITLLPKPSDPATSAAARQTARQNQAKHNQRQDQRLGQQPPNRNQNSQGNGGAGQQPDEKKLQQDKDKINQALGSQNQQQQPGEAKGDDSQKGDKKDGPSKSKDGQEPNAKPKDNQSPGNGGEKKDQGGGQGGAGESKPGGDGKKQDAANPGERKDGPKDSQGNAKDGGPMGQPVPQGHAKDGGPMGMNQPAPAQPKDQARDGNAPQPQAKPQPSDQAKGQGKGAEQDGPGANAKDAQAGPPPMPQAKAGKSPNGEPKAGPPDQAKNAGEPRGNGAGKNEKDVSPDRLKDLLDKLQKKSDADAAAAELLGIVHSDNPQQRELAKEILAANGRDPGTGKEKKQAPNPYGSNGKSLGISDDLKAEAANREFARRIGQLQLDDWKKRVTPAVLKKAGMSEADWQRFVKNMQAYDRLVQQRNAEILRRRVQELRGRAAAGSGVQAVEGTPSTGDPLDARSAPPPPELRDVQRRFDKK